MGPRRPARVRRPRGRCSEDSAEDCPDDGTQPSSETRIDRLALERENAEDALVDAVQRVTARRTVRATRSRGRIRGAPSSASSQASFAKSLEVLGSRVIRPIDDPEILGASALHGGLNESALTARDEVFRLHHNAFAAASRHFLPPRRRMLLARRVGELHVRERGRDKTASGQPRQSCRSVCICQT